MLEFKHAVEADPSIAAAHNALGHHYQRKGLLTKAADEFRSAALLSSDYKSHFNLGRVLTELEQHKEAADAFRHCLSTNEHDPSARYELAYVQCAQGEFSDALAQFQSLMAEYPEDWELGFAMANCHMGLRDCAAAEQTLRQALRRAPPSADTSAAHEALLVAIRHQEFPSQGQLGLKDPLYAEYGVICLGSSHDDGLDVPIYQNHTFTYRDVAVTLSRLLALLKEYGWQFTALVGVDKASMPLAIAASLLLDVPVLSIEQLRKHDFALVVLALGTQPELLEVTLEHLPSRMLSFALCLNWMPDQGLPTDIVGVHSSGECVLPWQRLRKRSAEAAATSILRALTTVPEEDNLSQQIAYYTQEHKLLRFLNLPPGLHQARPAT